MSHLRIAAALAGIVAFAPLGARADDPAFTGPSSWSHSPPPAQTDSTHTVDQWHIAGDVSSLTYIKDTTQTYDAALAAIRANVTTNNIKTSADRDVTCHGVTGHVIEFAYGPDGHRVVINRILVPDGTGIDTITYARGSDEAFDPDVKKAETAYCGAPV